MKLALLAMTLGLTACGQVLDSEEIRICRQTLPALSPDAEKITVTGIASADPLHGIRISYRVSGNGVENSHFVICLFDPYPKDNALKRLNGIASDTEIYSPVKLHILKRYWLDRPAATEADPGSEEIGPRVPEVPSSLVYFLQILGNGLPNIAMMMLMAVAYTLIYGLVGRINFTFGDFAAVGGFATISGMGFALAAGIDSYAAGLVLAGFLAVGIAMICGRVVEHYVFSPLAFRPGQSILIATIAVSTVMQETLRLTLPTQMRWAPPVLNTTIPFARAGGFVANVTPTQILVGVVAPALALYLVWFLRRTEFGRRWRAISDDAQMAGLMGISTRRILAQTFAIASALSGLAGFIIIARFSTIDAFVGNMIGLKGLVAAVIGGIGSIEGALLGGLLLGLFETFWQAYLPIEYRDVAVMVVLVAMLVFRPGGLLGYADSGPRQI